MTENTQLTHIQSHSKKFLLLSSFAFIFIMSLLVFNSGSNKVHAATVSCGINTGNTVDYAGAIIYLRWRTAADPTTLNTAHGVTVKIAAATVPPGAPNGLNTILEWSVASHPRSSQVTLPQTTNDCSSGGTEYDDPVVLAYTSGSDGEGGGYASPGDYVLDCDQLITAGNSISTFTFSVPGTQVPNGAPAGGYWDSVTKPTPNGATTVVILTYTAPSSQAVTISGSIDTKALPSGTATPLAGDIVAVDDATNGQFYSSTASTSAGIYTVSLPPGTAGNVITIGMESSPPSGDSGAETDYQGPANFTDISEAYNCTSSTYTSQIAGASQSLPQTTGCDTVASNSDYDFIFTSGTGKIPPNTGTCTGLTASGTGSTYTLSAAYVVASGVSYSSVIFNWGDGYTSTTGTNTGSAVTSAAYPYPASGTYTATATLSFSSSSASVPSSSCSTTVTVGGGSSGTETAPTFTCNTGSYDITATVNPSTPYIGADYPGSASIAFTSTGAFESDSNNPYNDNLAQTVNQSSQLFVSASSISSAATYNLTSGSNLPVGSVPIQTPVGIYSVPYQVQIVQVVPDPDPAAHWAPVPSPNPTLETPVAPPASSYTNETTTVAAPVYTTIPEAGTPTTGYFTKEDITTTYTYTDTTSTPTYTEEEVCTSLGDRGSSGACQGYTLEKVQTGTTTATTPVAIDTSDQYYYYVTWVSTPNVDCPPPVSVKIADQPYMKVYGGDVMAGSGFITSGSTTCVYGVTSNVIGWNWPTSSPSYSGAGNEFAAFAFGAINGFATDQNSSRGSGIGLSFANINTSITAPINPGAGEFGGSFNPVNCAPNFYSTMPATTVSPVPVNNLTSQAYYNNGDLTINGGNIQDSQHPVIYVNGNVYISGNINLGTRSGGNWANISDIPSFELIVKGNIYISSGVTNLDGIYIAQGGTIYDCSTGPGTQASPQDPSFYNICNQKLTINGSFIGTNVDLMRTGGTLYQSAGDSSAAGGGAASKATEIFNYNPAIWLGLTTNNTKLDNYNSIISLPPVL